MRAILQRRKYTGSFVYGASNAGKYFAMRDGDVIPRRKGDKAASAKPIVHENKFEAIVPQEQFDQVQRRLSGRKGGKSTKQARRYLLAGLAKCGDCNGAMGGISNGSKPVYHCRTYHQTGCTACHRNKVEEAPLVAAVVGKLQTEIFSEKAISRLLAAYRKRLAARRRVVPADDGRLRQRIDDLDQQIDQGAERVLSAPDNLVATIYAKLDKLKAERDRLKDQLDAAGQPETGSAATDAAKVEEAARVLRDMREAFADAEPEEVRDLLPLIVARIELHFTHETTSGGREQSTFSHGTIHVRPDAGEARSTDSNSSHLNTNGSFSDDLLAIRDRPALSRAKSVGDCRHRIQSTASP